MIYKDKGIVLHRSNFKESSLIVDLFSQTLGKHKYIVKGVRTKNKRFSIADFYPLQIIKYDAIGKSSSFIHQIIGLQAFPLSNITNDFIKLSLSFFISELVQKTLEFNLPDPSIYNFLTETIDHLNSKKATGENFHLIFMLRLSKFLGFAPRNNFILTKNNWFDLKNGHFTIKDPGHGLIVDAEHSKLLSILIQMVNYDEEICLTTRDSRALLTRKLLTYYELKHGIVNKLRSYEVLKSLFEF